MGKSTLADLLVRYLDPDQGRILIDGMDLRGVRLADLRERVMLVDQSPYLFNASIAENIAYARPGALRSEIEVAGAAAGLNELMGRSCRKGVQLHVNPGRTQASPFGGRTAADFPGAGDVAQAARTDSGRAHIGAGHRYGAASGRQPGRELAGRHADCNYAPGGAGGASRNDRDARRRARAGDFRGT